MSDDPSGYDFVYRDDVRVIVDSLVRDLKDQLREVEEILLTDQSPANRRIRYRYGITTIGVVTTANLEVYFQPVNPLVVRIIDIQVRA